MIVLDASAIVSLLTGGGPVTEALAQRIERGGARCAPHLVDVEVLHACRGLVIRGQLSMQSASRALSDLAGLRLSRYPHEPLLARALQFRTIMSACDAMYVVLAERLRCPLITCDGRLARGGGHRVTIEPYLRPQT